MTEINYIEKNKKIFEITPKDASSFYIGNTMNYSDYKSEAYNEETSIPKTVDYERFLYKIEEPFLNEIYVNPKKKFIFLVFKALMEFKDKKERLPFLNNNSDFEEIKNITKNIYENIKFEEINNLKKMKLFLMKKL